MLRGGGELVSVFAKEPDLVDAFVKRFPQAKRAREEKEVLEDKSDSTGAQLRDPGRPRAARHPRHEARKDYMSRTSRASRRSSSSPEARKVQAETKRIYSIMYSERFENRATVKAGELVKAGAIGQVIQTIGLGPHRITPASRPGLVLRTRRSSAASSADIGSHQADQFLYASRAPREPTSCSSQIGNVHHSDRPKFEDFGDVDAAEAIGGVGYIRVDWFTPDGLLYVGRRPAHDSRARTDSSRSARTSTSADARAASHLFLVDNKDTRYIDTQDVVLPYGDQLVTDVLNRTETAMSQAHCFLATELMLKAQAQAQTVRFGLVATPTCGRSRS